MLIALDWNMHLCGEDEERKGRPSCELDDLHKTKPISIISII